MPCRLNSPHAYRAPADRKHGDQRYVPTYSIPGSK